MSDLDLEMMRLADDSLDPAARDALLARLESDPALRRRLVEHWAESEALRTALAEPQVRLPRRWWRAKALLAGGVAAAAAALAIVLFLPTAGPVRDSDGTAVASGTFSYQHPETWAFGDGSRIAFAGGTQGSARFSRSLTAITVSAGSGDVRVHPKSPPDAWQVQAGPLAANVIGTHFSIQATPAGGRLALAEGSVELSCPGGAMGHLQAGRIAAGVAGAGWRSWPAPVQDGLLAVIIPAAGPFAEVLRGPHLALSLDGDPQPDISGSLRLERHRTMSVKVGSGLIEPGCSLVLWLTPLERSVEDWMPLAWVTTQSPAHSLTIGTMNPGDFPLGTLSTVALIQIGDRLEVVIAGRPTNIASVKPDLWATAREHGFELAIGQADDDVFPTARWSLLVHRVDFYRRALSLDECGVIAKSAWKD